MTYRQYLNSVDTDELKLQMAFERVEPIEDGWIQTGALMELVSGVAGSRSFRMAQVFPHLAPKPATAEQLSSQIETMFRAHEAVVKGQEVKGERLR